MIRLLALLAPVSALDEFGSAEGSSSSLRDDSAQRGGPMTALDLDRLLVGGIFASLRPNSSHVICKFPSERFGGAHSRAARHIEFQVAQSGQHNCQ